MNHINFKLYISNFEQRIKNFIMIIIRNKIHFLLYSILFQDDFTVEMLL